MFKQMFKPIYYNLFASSSKNTPLLTSEWFENYLRHEFKVSNNLLQIFKEF